MCLCGPECLNIYARLGILVGCSVLCVVSCWLVVPRLLLAACHGQGADGTILVHMLVCCVLQSALPELLVRACSLSRAWCYLSSDIYIAQCNGQTLKEAKLHAVVVEALLQAGYQTQDSFSFPSAEVFDEFADDFVINNGVIPSVKAQIWNFHPVVGVLRGIWQRGQIQCAQGPGGPCRRRMHAMLGVWCQPHPPSSRW